MGSEEAAGTVGDEVTVVVDTATRKVDVITEVNERVTQSDVSVQLDVNVDKLTGGPGAEVVVG